MADPVSGELVIVPDAEAFNSLKNYLMDWSAAVSYAAQWDDGTNTDYRLITKAEALEILTNNDLLSQLGLTGNEVFWTIEEMDTGIAYVFNNHIGEVSIAGKDSTHLAFPVRKVNFYGLPLIESEFGGGLVFDVVAETRTVSIVAKWADVTGMLGINARNNWDASMALFPLEIFTSLPTRAQALKIFGNSYLVTLAGLSVEENYWTSEIDEVENEKAFAYNALLGQIDSFNKTDFYCVLPVRSEVVPVM